jgi:hypothetical protein
VLLKGGALIPLIVARFLSSNASDSDCYFGSYSAVGYLSEYENSSVNDVVLGAVDVVACS